MTHRWRYDQHTSFAWIDKPELPTTLIHAKFDFSDNTVQTPAREMIPLGIIDNSLHDFIDLPDVPIGVYGLMSKTELV